MRHHLLRLLLGLMTRLLLFECASLLGTRHDRSLRYLLLELPLLVFVCSSIWVALEDLLDLFNVRVDGKGTRRERLMVCNTFLTGLF